MSSIIVNEKKFIAKMTERLKEAPIKHARIAVQLSADAVRNEAIHSIARGTKSGEVVKRYNPRRDHLQSASGQAPATDTGFLISQISASSYVEGDTAIGEVVSSAPYSKFLEYGTTSMGKRPFMRPALRKSLKQIKKIFIREGLIRLKGETK
jgi:HK97 gp10 family phage protein